MPFSALLLAAAQPLPPVSKWTVEYNLGNCVLQRRFGDPMRPVTLALMPTPASIYGTLALLMPSDGKSAVQRGKGTLAVLPSGERFDVLWASGLTSEKTRGFRFDAEKAFWEALPKAEAIAFDTGTDPSIAVSLGPTNGALAALKTCGDDLLRSWGANPEAMVLHTGQPSLVSLFGPDAYPVEALRNNEQGRVVTLTRFDEFGVPQECRAVQTSGSAILDSATCAAIKRKMRIGKSEAASAQPRYMILPVRWILPG